MIRLFALVLACVALGAMAAYVLRAEAGYVLVSYGPWIVETSLLGFVASTLAGLMLLAGALKLAQALVQLPRTLRERVTVRRERRAQQSFESGLHKLLHGHFVEAEIELVRRAADHRAPALNYLLAARAAQRAGAHERRDRYLALAGATDAPAAQLMTAELMLERDLPAAAVAVLEPLAAARPVAPHALEMLAEAYARTQAWAALRRLLAGPETQRALPPERHRALTAQALRAGIAAAVAEARLDALKAVWDSASPPFRGDATLRQAYLAGLARLGADAEAAAQIVGVLEAHWDPRLVTLYGELNGLDPVTQLATVEQWLQRHGETPEVLLAAGLVCTRNQLWGKARSYLDAALRLQPTAAVYLALARLCEQTRKPEEAQIFYRRGLELGDSSPGQVAKA